MMSAPRFLLVIAAAAWTALALPAQEQTGILVMFRVTSVSPRGRVVIDRGKSDRLAIDDVVVVLPRDGKRLAGRVAEVDERTAVVQLDDVTAAPPAGTRGEAWLEAARFVKPRSTDLPRSEDLPRNDEQPRSEPPSGAQGADKEAQPNVGERTKWTNRDEAWKPGMPLLTRVRPQRPEDRAWSMTGRAFAVTGLSHVPRNGTDNSFFRSGADLVFQNAFAMGGDLRVDAEINHKLGFTENRASDLLVRRLHYTVGGTRFARDRVDVGRFLHSDLPEFGVLDGLAWRQRTEAGHRYGASIGFLPEPNDDFESFKDLAFAGFLSYAFDEKEEFVVTGGYQKTFHRGHADRDLVVGRFSYTPEDSWQYFGSTWVDFYFGNDATKKDFAELTQALLTATRRYDDGARLDISLWHQMFPDVLMGLQRPLPQGRLRSDRHDRLTLSGWLPRGEDVSLRGTATLWNDEDETGSSLELGVERSALFFDDGTSAFTIFVADAAFETSFGFGVRVGRASAERRWELNYDFGYHHRVGFPSNFADIVQHRVFGEYEVPLYRAWDLRTWVDANVFDDDASIGVGFWVQRRF